jgi:hypothetical protein
MHRRAGRLEAVSAENPVKATGSVICSGRLSLLVVGLAVAGLLVSCPVAFAQIQGDQSADRWVTIAARECDSYEDIRANLARNDIMESLEDLGGDSLYRSGEPVDPRTELAGQPACRPVAGWRFTFGAGIRSRAVSGPWGSLSIVTDPDGGQRPVTQASVPARDFGGHPVGGGAKIDGAVTIGLDRDQVDRAERNSLWLQGGTPEDPVLYSDPQFAGRYGFGALRCAIDDLNGDNVETIQFPTGTRHMFCYAYYVTPPPSSGTIVVRKQVAGSEALASFGFTGNLSYNEGGVFGLSASESDPGSVEFVRAETGSGDEPWTVVEDLFDGWALTGLSCTSGASATTTDLAARRAQISLVAGDTVTCTFTNRLTPPAGALVLRKITRGGAGTFRFRVRDENGDLVARRMLTTRASDGVGDASVVKLDPGRYRITEHKPATKQGAWRLSGVSCNGTRRPSGGPVWASVAAGRGAICTFTNQLDRPGRIDIGTITLGGLGTAGYVVTPAGDPAVQRRQFATTKRQGATAPARGQSTDELPFGRYVIQETAVAAGQRAVWSLVAVVCNGRIVPFEQGRVTVRITRAAPEQDCRFLNMREPQPDPPPDPDPGPPGPSPTPDPGPPGPNPVPGGDPPDLVLDKQLMRSTGGHAPILTFRLRVRNRSAVAAQRVVVADRLAANTELVGARPSQGRCLTRGTRLLVCTLGDLAPGARADVGVRARQVSPRAGLNAAVVGSGSPEDVLRNNLDVARIAGLGRRSPSACPSLTRPNARAAC